MPCRDFPGDAAPCRRETRCSDTPGRGRRRPGAIARGSAARWALVAPFRLALSRASLTQPHLHVP
ncbi:hypothetical protein DF268_17865 [Streptomyces sp. V2]|nr:hypothetical protein DF268_17865 [Streptomyces sp. V2]